MQSPEHSTKVDQLDSLKIVGTYVVSRADVTVDVATFVDIIQRFSI